MKVETAGIDEVLEAMGRMQQLTGETAKAMLKAGGNVFQREWIRETKRLRHIQTGDMIKAIGQTNPKDKGDGLQVDIYPQGKGRTGTRNSVKAFVLHYGRDEGPDGKGEIKPDKWVEGIVQNAAEESNAAMADVWGKFIATGSVPVVKKLRKGQK